MMKHMIALILAAALLLCGLPSLAESAPENMTEQELRAFCAGLLTEALEMEPVTPQTDEEGARYFDYGDFWLYCADDQLTADSAVTAARLALGGEIRSDMRGIGPASSLNALLAAYPLENEELRGTYEEAVLYLAGALPETVNAGYVLRTGSRVLLAVHAVYTPGAEGISVSEVTYALNRNAVDTVLIAPGARTVSAQEAEREIARLAALLQQGDYAIYVSEDPEALAREDLAFGPIDFVSDGAEQLFAALGQPEGDTWAEDGDGYLRILQWHGVEAIMMYDGSRQNGSLQLMRVTSQTLEGPRGLRVEDPLDGVLSRFPRENERGILYGDGREAPYGTYEETGSGAYVVYAAPVEEKTVLLTLLFQHDELVEITCTY